MNLNDYFLVKAFEKSDYMESFNNGSVYLNSTSHFWELENPFQQDKEGLVFQHSDKGYWLKTRPGFENIIGKSSSFNELMERIEKENGGQVICEATDFSVKLNGYICCFYLLPKSDVVFIKNRMTITNEVTNKDIVFFLNSYLAESKEKDFYVSIYDAVSFCNIFFEKMHNIEYQITYGMVKYNDIDETQRIKWFEERNYQSIVFTKSTQFSYQKEFRIFLHNATEQIKAHIIVDGGEIYRSVLGSFCYEDIIKAKK